MSLQREKGIHQSSEDGEVRPAHSPLEDLCPALTDGILVVAAVVGEARVGAHEVAEQRMKLVLCPQLELEGVHKGDESLRRLCNPLGSF